MTIETEYNVGDTVWRMYDNKVIEDQIEQIVLRISHPLNKSLNIEESYILKIGGGGHKTDRFYSTKEKLIQSL